MGQGVQKLVHTLHLQGGAKEAGEQLPLADHSGEVSVRDTSGIQIPLQHRFVADGGFLRPFLRRSGEVHAAAVQPPLQLRQHTVPVRTRQIHFIYEKKHRHTIALQQPPQRPGMGLNAVSAADDQNGTVQHPERPLCLRGKVHMAGGIQQCHFHVPQGQNRLLGKDGDAALPLDIVSVQKSIPVVHPPQLPQGAAPVKQRLGQCCFSGIHMGQDAHDQFSHGFAPVQSYVSSYHFPTRHARGNASQGASLESGRALCYNTS